MLNTLRDSLEKTREQLIMQFMLSKRFEKAGILIRIMDLEDQIERESFNLL